MLAVKHVSAFNLRNELTILISDHYFNDKCCIAEQYFIKAYFNFDNTVVDPCDSPPCINGTCLRTGTSTYSCLCNEGYTGTQCDSGKQHFLYC